MNNLIKLQIRRSNDFRNVENLKDLLIIDCSTIKHEIKLPYQLV